MQYWFNDYIDQVQAPDGFITKFMVELESTLYDVGDTIIYEGDAVDNLVFILSGSCDLNGVQKVKKFNFEQYRKMQRRNIYMKSTTGLFDQEDTYDDNEEEYVRIKAVTLR